MQAEEGREVRGDEGVWDGSQEHIDLWTSYGYPLEIYYIPYEPMGLSNDSMEIYLEYSNVI
jgi:hypothetical protein